MEPVEPVFDWDAEKNEWLKKERNVSFEQLIYAIETDRLVDIKQHPKKEKYKNQIVLYVELESYIYVVPCVIESKRKYFLKTAFPSRKVTKKYLGKGDES